MKIYLLMSEHWFGDIVDSSIIRKAYLDEHAAQHACATFNENKQDAGILYYVVDVECEA